MSIIIYNKDEQASGNFNNGNILEKKPIGFPQDGGQLRPYSNLFYWADAWTPNSKSTIGLHPHQGFEICSFVIKGSIKHFDSKQNEWIELNRGDAQIIRSGNGISHAEEILDNSEMRKTVLKRLEEIVYNVSKANNAKSKITYMVSYPITYNDMDLYNEMLPTLNRVNGEENVNFMNCLLYTSPSPRD